MFRPFFTPEEFHLKLQQFSIHGMNERLFLCVSVRSNLYIFPLNPPRLYPTKFNVASWGVNAIHFLIYNHLLYKHRANDSNGTKYIAAVYSVGRSPFFVLFNRITELGEIEGWGIRMYHSTLAFTNSILCR